MATASTTGLAGSPAVAIALRVPASAFSLAMGVGALGAAWAAAARAYKVSPWVANALLATAVAVWVAILVAQVVKAVAARDELGAELLHPVDGSLAALGPASLLLVAAGLAAHSRDLALALFWIGAAAQLGYAVFAVGRWLTTALDPKLVTPALYLPSAVGNLVAAYAAGAVGKIDAGWLFLGAGVVSWVLVGATLLGRHLSAGELSPSLRPLLGLELAPPAVAFIALQSIDGASPDAALRTFLGFSLFVALVLLRLAGRLRAAPFSAAHWAFAFPLAALSAGALRQATAAPASVGAALALPLFVVANAVTAMIAFRTAVALSRGELFPRA
jgi:tellurite resistance protein